MNWNNNFDWIPVRCLIARNIRRRVVRSNVRCSSCCCWCRRRLMMMIRFVPIRCIVTAIGCGYRSCRSRSPAVRRGGVNMSITTTIDRTSRTTSSSYRFSGRLWCCRCCCYDTSRRNTTSIVVVVVVISCCRPSSTLALVGRRWRLTR